MDGLIYIGLGGLGLIFMAKWLRAEGFKAKYEQEVQAHARTVALHREELQAVANIIGCTIRYNDEWFHPQCMSESWPDLLEVPNEQ